jgi:hypothetical protein
MKDGIANTPKNELAKNLFAWGLLGMAFGFIYAISFDWNIVLFLIVGTLVGLALGFRVTVRPPRMRFPMALARRMAFAGTLLLLAGIGYSYLLDLDLSQGQKFLAALLPLAGWAFLIISIGTAIARLDEMQRRIQTEAIAIGFAGTAILVGGWGLLGFAGFSQPNWGLVIMVMSVMWLAGKLWTLWRYR